MGEKKDSFRFTVQFNASDPSHQQVAAILNEQGRRKAQFLVNAVTHYMNCPETPEAAAAPRTEVIAMCIKRDGGVWHTPTFSLNGW